MARTSTAAALACVLAGCDFFGLPDEVEQAPRVIVEAPAGLATDERGGTAEFTVALAEAPDAPVSIPVSTSNAAEGTASPSTLTFTPEDWTPKSVTVKGIDDRVADGDATYTVLLGPAESSGFFGGIDPADVEVVNEDDDAPPSPRPAPTPTPTPAPPPAPPPGPGDSPGISVTPTSGLRTTEAGGQATFTAVLRSRPTSDVTVSLASNRPSEGVADVPGVTFTPSNWNTPQTVTVTGVDDAIAGVDQPYVIVTGPAVSSDPSYSGLDPPDVHLMNEDDDVAAVLVGPTAGLVTSERGDAAVFAIRLGSQPTASVTIPLSTSRPREGRLTVESVTFTPLDWLVPQSVTVIGVDDRQLDGDQAFEVATGPAVSEDPEYAGLDAPDASVTNLDDDTR